MGSGLSIGSFGLLLLLIACSMVLVSSQFASEGQKTVFDAKEKSGKATLETSSKSLTGAFKANGATIAPNTDVDATFDFGGCKITGKLYKRTKINFEVGGATMNLDLTFELAETGIKFKQENGASFPAITCTTTFNSGDASKSTIEVSVELGEAIPGMKFEFDASQKGTGGKKSDSGEGDAESAGGFNVGWIVLIVVVVLLIVLAIVGFCVYWFWYRPKHKDDKDEAKDKRKGKRKLFGKGTKRKPDDTDDDDPDEDDPAKKGALSGQQAVIPQQQQIPQQQVPQQQVPQQQVPQLQVPQLQVGQQQVPQLQVGQQHIPQQQVPQLQVPQLQVGQQHIPQQQAAANAGQPVQQAN
ncbi:hypothetical protein M3Y94_00883000 [Aphelenchoides besseyi]|nr:hypothetical protein M3Y94_00883000 [Aphelenchoides besseyi]KAI6223525.1 hypothetical protein M3Y95_00899200 [Aphelenchoides besseyi]